MALSMDLTICPGRTSPRSPPRLPDGQVECFFASGEVLALGQALLQLGGLGFGLDQDVAGHGDGHGITFCGSTERAF